MSENHGAMIIEVGLEVEECAILRERFNMKFWFGSLHSFDMDSWGKFRDPFIKIYNNFIALCQVAFWQVLSLLLFQLTPFKIVI